MKQIEIGDFILVVKKQHVYEAQIFYQWTAFLIIIYMEDFRNLSTQVKFM